MVIVVLGIVAATALPRYFDASTSAHRSAVAGTGAAFQSAVGMVRMTYRARGYVGAVDNVIGFGNNNIDVNTAGFPTDTASSNTITGTGTCIRVWNGLLLNPPSTTTTTNTAFHYRVTRAGQVCTYTYLRSTGPTRSIVYDAATGAVTVTNP